MIEQIQKEYETNPPDNLCACPFCGQVTYISDNYLTEPERQRAAKEVCTCEQAQKWRDEELRIKRAEAELLAVLCTDLVESGEQPSERLSDLLCELLPLMVRDGVTQFSVTVDDVGKIAVTYNGNWKIKKQRGVCIERKV